jgi:hypothetical protein
MRFADRMARFNRRLANPIIRTFAGRRLSPVTLVVHRGRNSGRRYRTPVLAVPVGEGYVVSLPYGASPRFRAGLARPARSVQGRPLAADLPDLLDVCGHRDGPKQLSVRVWTCGACGVVVQDRDVTRPATSSRFLSPPGWRRPKTPVEPVSDRH